jgi:hypothetical protein
MSSLWKLSCATTFIFALLYLLPTTPAAALQAPEGMSEQLDATLARHFENSYASGYTFEDRINQLSQANGTKPKQIEITKTVEGHPVAGVDPSRLPPPSSRPAWGGVMNSGLIIIGTPIRARSLPIEDRTFLFTEYAVRIEKVVSPDQNSILPGDAIIVSRGGGETVVDGVLVKATESVFRKLLLNQRYILMLRPVPLTTSYRAYAFGTFAIRDGLVFSTSTLENDTTPIKDLPSFLADINAALERKHSVEEERKRADRN